MISQQQIRDVLQRRMQLGCIYHLRELNAIVEEWCSLDDEDYDPQAPGSTIPKWKRNVRNVLKKDRRPAWIIYHGSAKYERR